MKEITSETRISCDSRDLPVRTQSRGCFIVVGLSTESVTPMSGLEEIHPQPGEMFLQASSEGELRRAPVVPWSPNTENWENVGKAG